MFFLRPREKARVGAEPGSLCFVSSLEKQTIKNVRQKTMSAKILFAILDISNATNHISTLRSDVNPLAL